MERKRLATAKEKVVLHLAWDLSSVEKYHPYTQEGIAEATGLLRNHIPRALGALMKEGLVAEKREHVTERGRRMKIYVLTSSGRKLQNQIMDKLREIKCSTDKGEMSLAEAVAKAGPGVIDTAKRGEAIRLTPGPPPHSMDFHPPMRPPEVFVGREEEKSAVREFLLDPAKRVLVIYGGVGSGRKTLANLALHELASKPSHHKSSKYSACYVIDLSSGRKEKLDEQMASALRSRGLRWEGRVETIPDHTIILFHDLYELSEQMADALQALAMTVSGRKGIKMLVTAREDTPVYNRFFQGCDPPAGQITLRGLGLAESAQLMGMDPEMQEMKKIHQFLKGKPMALKMLHNEDREGLLSITPLSPEEIRLLFYLKKTVQKTGDDD
ncbi:MAG: hypothetical protein QCI38_07690 [Candidatus Thermoplasmatota archaeon]|nr:hypothetical protein [Candidatus Thermoplasmatota archaeon]